MIFNDNLFRNKNILVTGANSGLGLDVCQEISNLGGAITGVSRSIDKQIFSKQIKTVSSELLNTVSIDFSSKDLDFDKFDMNVKYDAIFLSAGISKVSGFVQTDEETMESMFDINVIGQLKLLRYLLKKKLVKSNASIVFMSSINGTSLGSKGHSIYAATKGALNGVTMSLANELSKKRIRVNAVASGLVKTPMFIDNLRLTGEDSMKEYEKTYPLGFGTPNDVSNLAIFLLSDGARWITGQTYIIDGGHSIV